MKRTLITMVLLATGLRAQDLPPLPAYAPGPEQFGEIRMWGNEEPVMNLWKDGFHKIQPGISFWGNSVSGTAAGIGALYAGVADIGVLGRAAVPLELHAFRAFFGYDVLEIAVASGSYDGDETPGSVIFVNVQNPISRMTLKQLDGIFGAQRSGGWNQTEWSTEPRRSAKDNIRTWGQLGLTGEWADKEIQVYGYDLTVNGFAFAFQRNVFRGGDTWNPNLREFPISEPGRKGAVPKSGARRMMKTLGEDKYGIALGATKYGREEPKIKPLALAFTEAGPYVAPSRESFIDWSYPLLEPVCIYINRVPGKPLDPKIKDFVRYILSREGQNAVVKEGTYLPLNEAEIRNELRKIE